MDSKFLMLLILSFLISSVSVLTMNTLMDEPAAARPTGETRQAMVVAEGKVALPPLHCDVVPRGSPTAQSEFIAHWGFLYLVHVPKSAGSWACIQAWRGMEPEWRGRCERCGESCMIKVDQDNTGSFHRFGTYNAIDNEELLVRTGHRFNETGQVYPEALWSMHHIGPNRATRGHMRVVASELEAFAPSRFELRSMEPGVLFGTILRNPIDRTISHFRFFVREKGPEHMRSMTFANWYRKVNRDKINMYVTTYGGIEDDERNRGDAWSYGKLAAQADEAMLERAKERLQRFDLVLISENTSHVAPELFDLTFGWENLNASIVVNPYNHSASHVRGVIAESMDLSDAARSMQQFKDEEVGPELLAEMERENALDLELYRWAIELERARYECSRTAWKDRRHHLLVPLKPPTLPSIHT